MLKSDEMQTDYQELSDRGVTFNGKPKEVLGGKGMKFEDLYGNKFDLYQPGAEQKTGGNQTS